MRGDKRARATVAARVEHSIDRTARRMLDAGRQPRTGVRLAVTEFLVFGAKQAWACAFGAALLSVIVLVHVFMPADAPIASNDLLTIAAIAIQAAMLLCGLETFRELRVVMLFHIVGTVMELFKTHVGSWEYYAGGVLHIGAVPLFSGFMYAAVGSYMVRVCRLFDLRFDRYPRQWMLAVLAVAIYGNFFTSHAIWDVRYLLLALAFVLLGPTVMEVRIHRAQLRIPVLAAMGGVALFIWFAENIATFADAWYYPAQDEVWHPVAPAKIVAWFLLMTISMALVTWLYPAIPATVRRIRRVRSGARHMSRLLTGSRNRITPIQVVATVVLAVPCALLAAAVAAGLLGEPEPDHGDAMAVGVVGVVGAVVAATACTLLHILAVRAADRLGRQALPWWLWGGSATATWGFAVALGLSEAGSQAPVTLGGASAMIGGGGAILAVLLAIRIGWLVTHRAGSTS